MADPTPTSDAELRKKALKRLKKKQSFKQSLFSFIVINAFLVVIWAVSGQGFFWPVFVIAGWGIGLLFQARDAYGHADVVTEDQVQREMEKLKSG